METVAGIFDSRADAERAVKGLQSTGVANDRIAFLTPGTSNQESEAAVPTTETEQEGMGGALGATVGGAMGVAGGATLGAVAASLLVPGVGPVIAAGIVGAALLGAGGAATGMAAGAALEKELATGLPHGELYIYEDALRKGHSVVIAFAEDDDLAERARNIMAQAGAESIDAAKDTWWLGLRDAEQESYQAQGRDFKRDEINYRRGFEGALNPKIRGRSYDEALADLRGSYKEACTDEAFRHGYARGQAYNASLRERHKS